MHTHIIRDTAENMRREGCESFGPDERDEIARRIRERHGARIADRDIVQALTRTEQEISGNADGAAGG